MTRSLFKTGTPKSCIQSYSISYMESCCYSALFLPSFPTKESIAIQVATSIGKPAVVVARGFGTSFRGPLESYASVDILHWLDTML